MKDDGYNMSIPTIFDEDSRKFASKFIREAFILVV